MNGEILPPERENAHLGRGRAIPPSSGKSSVRSLPAGFAVSTAMPEHPAVVSPAPVSFGSLPPKSQLNRRKRQG